jgi:uncharacterized repeat protein (TIGR01451 family)
MLAPSRNSLATALLAPLATCAALLLPACDSAGQKTASTEDGRTWTELAFPTGDRSTSAILVRQTGPREPVVGRECSYTIDVTNLTSGTLRNVRVNVDDLSNVQFVSSQPEHLPGTNGDISWVLSDLPPHGTRSIRIRAKPVAEGTTSNCLSASYANTLCTTATAVAPSLDISKTATPEVCGACNDIRITYTVRNPGSGTAEGVVISDTFPEGLRTADGKSRLSLDAGDLPPGGERTFTVSAKAEHGGKYASAATVTSESGIDARTTEVLTVVKEPTLAFSCDANNRAFLGRDLAYRITVKNTGQCDASGATVRATVPEGCRFVSADGSSKQEGRAVTWNLERLLPGRSATVTMNLHPSAVGEAKVTAAAWADCVPSTATECMTEVVGIPAILLEVVDTVDPVEVGTETSFDIAVTNQGSSADGKVTVVGTLPASMEFVSGRGATAVSCSGQVVSIAPLGTLAPGARAEWRIVVRAKSAADARSRWEMTSEQFKVPVVETESSNLYR